MSDDFISARDVSGEDRPPGPDEVKISFIVPKALVATGLSVAIFAGALAEDPGHGSQTVTVVVRDSQVFIPPPEHAEDRAPLGTYVGSEVMVVATTSVSSRHLAVLWDARQALGVNVRGA